MPWQSLRVLITLLAVFSLGACGTVHRPADGLLRPSATLWRPAQEPRVRAGDTARVQALSEDIAARFANSSDPPTILALSGGGSNGAYGAGLMVGWTQSGKRPKFSIVTGVSTGALAAPFAFLGPEWDDELKAVYTEGGTRGLLSWRSVTALVAPSLFSPNSLNHLVDQYVTPELLRQVAAEYAKGRRLFIVTTDLDAEESVIWDMGLLASQGGPEALALFRKIMLASASIPGVFPPVMINGTDSQGRAVQEMHVDGGVNTPFLGVPESLLLTTDPNGARAGTALYVLINGQVGRNRQITRGVLPAILARSYDSMSKANTRTILAANLAFAQRSRMQMYLAAIPEGIPATGLDFNPASMTELFERGRTAALNGTAWTKLSGDGALETAVGQTPPGP